MQTENVFPNDKGRKGLKEGNSKTIITKRLCVPEDYFNRKVKGFHKTDSV